MNTKAIDIVKPEPETEYEMWQRWLNHICTVQATAPWAKRKVIEVKYEQ